MATMGLAMLTPVAILAAAASQSAAPQASSPATLDAGRPAQGTAILERAGRYVLQYEEKFEGIAADEKQVAVPQP